MVAGNVYFWEKGLTLPPISWPFHIVWLSQVYTSSQSLGFTESVKTLPRAPCNSLGTFFRVCEFMFLPCLAQQLISDLIKRLGPSHFSGRRGEIWRMCCIIYFFHYKTGNVLCSLDRCIFFLSLKNREHCQIAKILHRQKWNTSSFSSRVYREWVWYGLPFPWRFGGINFSHTHSISVNSPGFSWWSPYSIPMYHRKSEKITMQSKT